MVYGEESPHRKYVAHHRNDSDDDSYCWPKAVAEAERGQYEREDHVGERAPRCGDQHRPLEGTVRILTGCLDWGVADP